jgi:hypothetical protein
MATEQLVFGWTISPGGYRWISVVDRTDHPQQALIPIAPERTIAPWLTPKPEPALFRIFAGLKPDQKSILAFAKEYGNLWYGPELSPVNSADAPPSSPLRGTSLGNWEYQVADMHQLVRIWDLLQADDQKSLTAHVRWRKKGRKVTAVEFVFHPEKIRTRSSQGSSELVSVIASIEKDPASLAQFEVGDPVLPAWLYLRQEIATHLDHLAQEMVPTMVWDPGTKRPVLAHEAPTLASAVWFQFAQALTHDKVFSQCRTCGKWFEVAPEVARSHRRYCSNSCRSKGFRERQDRARQLFMSKKMTFEQIAEELDSDVATVKRWITGLKESIAEPAPEGDQEVSLPFGRRRRSIIVDTADD